MPVSFVQKSLSRGRSVGRTKRWNVGRAKTSWDSPSVRSTTTAGNSMISCEKGVFFWYVVSATHVHSNARERQRRARRAPTRANAAVESKTKPAAP